MTENEARRIRAEQFVGKVLRETFRQEASAETVKAVAAKVLKAMPPAAAALLPAVG